MKALFLIDTQENMFDKVFGAYESERILNRIVKLINAARKKKVILVYIQNNGSSGDPDEKDSMGWQIQKDLIPQTHDFIVQKNTPNSFENTNLNEIINEQHITEVYICGFQTNYCVYETVKAAFEEKLLVKIISDAHSTYDEDDMNAKELIEKYNQEMRNYGELLTSDEIMKKWET